MTVIVGPMACKGCGIHVWLARLTVVFPCKAHGPRSGLCTSESLERTIVDANGERHLCAA